MRDSRLNESHRHEGQVWTRGHLYQLVDIIGEIMVKIMPFNNFYLPTKPDFVNNSKTAEWSICEVLVEILINFYSFLLPAL